MRTIRADADTNANTYTHAYGNSDSHTDAYPHANTHAARDPASAPDTAPAPITAQSRRVSAQLESLAGRTVRPLKRLLWFFLRLRAYWRIPHQLGCCLI